MSTWPAYRCPNHPALEMEDFRCAVGCTFDVVGGIPRIANAARYAASWGPQWKHHRLTQLDSRTGLTLSRDRLRRMLGEELWAALDGMHVLEVGCGAGRFTEILLERGAFVTAVDLSAAIEANRDSFQGHPRYRAAQADACRLPFGDDFDAVLAIGMVQHTPAPRRTIRSVARHVRPGGWVVVDHYPRDWTQHLTAKILWRQWLKRLRPETGLAVTDTLVDWLLPLHRAAGDRRLAQSLLARVSPICHYYVSLPELSPELQEAWARLDTHDTLTDTYQHRRSPEEIDEALAAADIVVEYVGRGGNGVEARGRRTTDPLAGGQRCLAERRRGRLLQPIEVAWQMLNAKRRSAAESTRLWNDL